ncbi:MAG: Na/Pi cotransporter family protein [Chitinophagaceae bacterium]
MSTSLDIWKMLAGVAIFLLGMNFLEEGLKRLAARPFKLFLKKQTSNKAKAVAGGAIITGLLQSSSIVNLMVLAFSGAGMIKLRHALAIILGANLGSTLTSWLLVTIGFNLNIESFALPGTGVFGILMLLANKEKKWYQWCKLLFGFSFMFLGLNYIKSGVEGAVQQVDLSSLNHQPLILFLLAGLLVTTLVQSSSATVAIVLSLLHVNAISFLSAAAIVLGSEIGTTIKLVLASVKGSATKKRVALGNLLFNVITAGIIFIFILPITRLIDEIMVTGNNLVALVLFQSLVNIVSILLFYPFLSNLGHFLEKWFTGNDDESLFIGKVSITDPELALEALEKETRHFIFHVMNFIASALDARKVMLEEMMYKNFQSRTVMEKYNYIKQLHGEIHAYFVKLQTVSNPGMDPERLEHLISSVRNCMYAAKNIRDALMDIEQLRNSSNDMKYNFYLATKQKIESFFDEINILLQEQHRKGNLENITRLYRDIQGGYTKSLQELYKEGTARHLSELEISTLINFNREMYTAFKSMIFAIKDYLLDSKEADHFDELPGFIR